MTDLDPDGHCHIETCLGCELTAEELAESVTFDDVNGEQLRVVETAREPRDPGQRLRGAVVPSADFSDARYLVFTIQDFIAEKDPPAPLAIEHLHEGELGRPLTDQERRVVDLIPDLKDAHSALARQLASRDPGLVRRYLREVPRKAPRFEIEVLVDYLRRESDP